jgi:rubrerythrin
VVDEPTRRTFLRGAGAGVIAVPALSGLALGGCGGGGAQVTDEGTRLGTGQAPAPDSPGGDAELLNSALAAEHLSIAAYNAGLPLLEGTAHDAGRRFLSQEREHADRLRQLIEGLGARAVGPLPSYDFETPGDQGEMLRLLQRVERKTVAVYGGLVPRLADPLVRTIAASIATVEAEHDAVLRMQLGRWPAPTPFVTGAA